MVGLPFAARSLRFTPLNHRQRGREVGAFEALVLRATDTHGDGDVAGHVLRVRRFIDTRLELETVERQAQTLDVS
jgi:hypothetical protein